MEGTKPRSKSGYYTDQRSQGTCYAHAPTRMIARLIKVIFSPFFNEGEKCGELYITDKDISDMYSNHETWDKCNDEILSALLFRLIYQIIVDKYEWYDGSDILIYDHVIFIFGEIRKKKSLKYIKNIIRYDKIISKIQYVDIHNRIEELLKLLLSIICVFVNFNNSNIIKLKCIRIFNGSSLNPLIKVLKRRYYAIIYDSNHVMTKTG